MRKQIPLWGLLWIDCFKKVGNCGYYPRFSRDNKFLQVTQYKQYRLMESNAEIDKCLALNRQVVGLIPTASTIKSITYNYLSSSFAKYRQTAEELFGFLPFWSISLTGAFQPSCTAAVREFTASRTLRSIL